MKINEQVEEKRIGLFISSHHLSFCLNANYLLLFFAFHFFSWYNFEQQKSLLVILFLRLN